MLVLFLTEYIFEMIILLVNLDVDNLQAYKQHVCSKRTSILIECLSACTKNNGNSWLHDLIIKETAGCMILFTH